MEEIAKASDNTIGDPCELWIEKARIIGWNTCCRDIKSGEKPAKIHSLTKRGAINWFLHVVEKFDFRVTSGFEVIE